MGAAAVAGVEAMCHNNDMAHKIYKVRVGERGRVVLPARVRRSLGVEPGDVLALELDESDRTLRVRTAAEVARSARGLLRDVALAVDLAAELIADRREEARREDAADGVVAAGR
jgi:AbrB family looped-hinge helix DNA binding protein